MGYPITKPINYQKPNIGVIQHCIETVIIEPTTAGDWLWDLALSFKALG